jgi:hypothetical protein
MIGGAGKCGAAPVTGEYYCRNPTILPLSSTVFH